jgi:hypothetical protein
MYGVVMEGTLDEYGTMMKLSLKLYLTICSSRSLTPRSFHFKLKTSARFAGRGRGGRAGPEGGRGRGGLLMKRHASSNNAGPDSGGGRGRSDQDQFNMRLAQRQRIG